MNKKLKAVWIGFLTIVVCCLVISCKNPINGNGGDNEEVFHGIVRPPIFSHESGLYTSQFNLTLEGREETVIYYSIDGSIPLPSKVDGKRVFKYTVPITVKNRNGEANVLATVANTEKFCLKPDDPRGDIPMFYIPYASDVPKATVIRAMAVDSHGGKSSVVTNTYFIGNNLANYGNHPVISLVTDPGNLLDVNTGIYVQGPGNRWWNSNPPYNFCMSGREWEREANLEFFDAARKAAFSTGVGVRIRGAYSRDKGQKSWNVYFREEYGVNSLTNYPLIPGALNTNGSQITTNKNFMLRNGGNDTEYTKLYDLYLQGLVKDRSFTTQAGVPCIVYLNGEYWGPYNIQEKYSDHYLANKFGVNRNNVVVIKTGELEEGIDADMNLFQHMMALGEADMSNQSNYDAFFEVFDLQSYLDYYAAEIYINNEDWPHNNYQAWRVRNPEPGIQTYGDGKWRWQMYDTEFALGIYRNGGVTDPFQRIFVNKSPDHPNNKQLKNLFNNETFCKQFILTMMDLYNVNFDYNTCVVKLDDMADVYRPLMENGYYDRFGFVWKSFDEWINNMKSYLWDIRSAMTTIYLPNHFGSLGISAGNLADVTIAAKDGGTSVHNASIKINTATPGLAGGSWTGKYYSVLPVTVKANVPNGYTFTGWDVVGGNAETPESLETVVNFTGNVLITANYELTAGGITMAGDLAIPALADTVGYVKLILHDAAWSWKSEIGIVSPEDISAWSTKIAPFASSTPIFFRVEGYENQTSINSLYIIDAGISQNVYASAVSGINIDLSNIQLIKLSGSISLASHVPSSITHIGLKVLANDTMLGQALVTNTGSASVWQMYVPSQTGNTSVTWNIYGFSNEVLLWGQKNPLSSENNILSCSSIYNTSVSNIDILDFALTPASLEWSWGGYGNIDRVELPDGEYKVTVAALGINRWDAVASFDYNGELGVKYTYSFYARTEIGTRSIYIQYYWTEPYGSLGQNITITETEQLFVINGSYLPSSGWTGLQFQCADQLGIFFVRDVTITPY